MSSDDNNNVTQLMAFVDELMGLVELQLKRAPITPDNVYLALNGLAVVSAMLLAGAPDDRYILEFFDRAVHGNIAAFRDDSIAPRIVH